MEKRTLTIRVSAGFCDRLKENVGRGKMGDFIEKVVDRALSEQETELAKEYQRAYQNPRLLELAKKWEKMELESWHDYEKGRNKN
jgi:hypothetical protein